MKKTIIKQLIILALILGTAFCSFAETFYLKSGEKIDGTVIEDTTDDCVLIKIPKEDVFKSKKERYNAGKNWKRHFFEMTGGLGASHCYDHGGKGYGFVIGGHVTTGFTYNYGFSKYFAMGHGVRFKVDIVRASNGFNDVLHPKSTNLPYYVADRDYENEDVKDRKWSVIGNFTFSLVDQFMFGSIKNKQLAAVVDLLYGPTVGGGLGIYYRGFVGKFIYSYDIPILGAPLHSFSLSFGYKISAKANK